MVDNQMKEHVFVVGRERPGERPLILEEDGSVVAFEAREDALHFLQLRDAPHDAGVARVVMSDLLDFAEGIGCIVEVVAPGDDYPTTILQPGARNEP